MAGYLAVIYRNKTSQHLFSRTLLIDNLKIKVLNKCKVKLDCEIYRIILDFININREKGTLLKGYYIWM
jgi:hypothetical protein